MSKKFQVNDRVCFYDQGKRFIGEIRHLEHSTDGILRIVTDPNTTQAYIHIIHIKQCRRLIKRKKREIWVHQYHLDGTWSDLDQCAVYTSKRTADDVALKDRVRCVRFVEAKEQ